MKGVSPLVEMEGPDWLPEDNGWLPPALQPEARRGRGEPKRKKNQKKGTACKRCRKAKAKCEDARPCGRCVYYDLSCDGDTATNKATDTTSSVPVTSEDVKFCAACGLGSTQVEQQTCNCGSASWNFSGVSEASTGGVQGIWLQIFTAMAQSSAPLRACGQGDEIVSHSGGPDGGIALALAALKSKVETARSHEGARGRRWDFRSAHLGNPAGIFAHATRDDLLRAFLLWAQTREDRDAGSFNISRAFNRASMLATFSEEHFDKY